MEVARGDDDVWLELRERGEDAGEVFLGRIVGEAADEPEAFRGGLTLDPVADRRTVRVVLEDDGQLQILRCDLEMRREHLRGEAGRLRGENRTRGAHAEHLRVAASGDEIGDRAGLPVQDPLPVRGFAGGERERARVGADDHGHALIGEPVRLAPSRVDVRRVGAHELDRPAAQAAARVEELDGDLDAAQLFGAVVLQDAARRIQRPQFDGRSIRADGRGARRQYEQERGPGEAGRIQAVPPGKGVEPHARRRAVMLVAVATPAARTAASATQPVEGGSLSGSGAGGGSRGNAWSYGIAANGNAAKRVFDGATGVDGPAVVVAPGVGVVPGAGTTPPGEVGFCFGLGWPGLLAVAVGSGEGSSGGGGWVGVCCGQIEGGHPPGIGSASATTVGTPPLIAHAPRSIAATHAVSESTSVRERAITSPRR